MGCGPVLLEVNSTVVKSFVCATQSRIMRAKSELRRAKEARGGEYVCLIRELARIHSRIHSFNKRILR